MNRRIEFGIVVMTLSLVGLFNLPQARAQVSDATASRAVMFAEIDRLADDVAWWDARDDLLERSNRGGPVAVLDALKARRAEATGSAAKRIDLVMAEIDAANRAAKLRRSLRRHALLASEALAASRVAQQSDVREQSLGRAETALKAIETELKEFSSTPRTGRCAPLAEKAPPARGDFPTTLIELPDGTTAIVPLPEGEDTEGMTAEMVNGQLIIKMPRKKKVETKEPEQSGGEKDGKSTDDLPEQRREDS